VAWTVVIVGRSVAAQRPDLVEFVYALQVYPALAGFFARTTARVPLSIAEVVAAASVVVAVVWLVSRLVRLVSGAVTVRGVLFGLLKLVAMAGQTVVLFDLLWGLNYARRSVAELLDLDTAPPRAEELVQAAEALLAQSAERRADLPEGPDGALRLPDGVPGALARTPAGFGPALAPLPIPSVNVVPKTPHASALLSYLGIGGIYVPFTGEPQVNATLPDWEIPFTACHEVAHQRGFAREDEANFVAYQACREHPDADFRYSASFRAALYVLTALAQADAASYRRLRSTLVPPLERDLAALAAWRKRYASRLSEVQDKVNDAYLKGQGQREGVQSYGRVVDLILAERRKAPPAP
jgi:hypothetical protein